MSGTFTKRATSPHTLRYLFSAGTANPTFGVATLMAATMLADAAPGPLKDWIRKHYQENSSTWAGEQQWSPEISVSINPLANLGTGDTTLTPDGPFGVSFGGASGVNNVVATAFDAKADGPASAIVEIRYNHTLVR